MEGKYLLQKRRRWNDNF